MSSLTTVWRSELQRVVPICCVMVLIGSTQNEPASAAEIGSEPTAGSADAAPFVPGFERFTRHDEISEVTGGRLLISELSCTACHAATDDLLAPKRGPDLTGVGNRVDDDWLRDFLTSPAQTKPGTTMPDCFVGMPDEEKKAAVAALTAFLSTQHEPFPEIRATGANPVPYRFWEKGEVARGESLYHQIGCVACHAPDAEYDVASIKTSQFDQMLEELSDEELEELGFASAARPVRSVPLPDLAAKYTSESLTHFLLAPEKARPGGRMPDFQLTAMDAADISAYLLRHQERSTAEPTKSATGVKAPEAVRAEGRRLFTTLGCAQCHRNGKDPASPLATPLGQLDWSAERRCDVATQGAQPFFPIDAIQTSAIKAASAVVTQGIGEVADAARFRMLQLNCFACHTRDELGGVGQNRKAYFETVGNVDLGDEGRLPPPLTGAGRKLTRRWLQQVLKGDAAVRPYMRIRMPKYPAAMVASLPDWLAAADVSQGKTQKTSETETEAEIFTVGEKVDSGKLSEAGRRLLDTGCVQCHPVQGEALPGVVGVDLGAVSERIRPAWFRDFIREPGSLKPRTRMPTFFPDGKSQDASLLGGNTDKQIAALWTYLKRSKSLPLPEKIQEARSQDYELKPTTEPLLLRTFMPHAGTHAIAVGFPESVHYAFDAETSRLAVLWRGGFIDAQGTWFVRFAPPADPLGEPIVLPSSFPFALLDASADDRPWPTPSISAASFGGYRIDREGVPTLLYRWNGLEIEDRIVPTDKQGFERTLTLKGRVNEETSKTLWFRAHVGKQLQAVDKTARSDRQGLTVRLPDQLAAAAIERVRADATDGQKNEWLVPLTLSSPDASGSDKNDAMTIKVQYEW